MFEPCPPNLAQQDIPQYGGSLFHHQETGISGCPNCGWSGVPTIMNGFASTYCPQCEREPDQITKVARNQVCPCGSGKKAKKCDCPEYCV